jgi:probable F420-dependent oxidoreductase
VEGLSPIGIWSRQLRFGDPVQATEAAAELDELGYGALWIPDVGGPVLKTVAHLLGVTRRTVVATGILNVWMHDASEVAAGQSRLDDDYPSRFLLGLGISHAPIVDAEQPGRYQRPLATMRTYLDALDAATLPGRRPARLLAALGPKMLQLAGERTLGTHPYLVPVEHTAFARDALGAGGLVAPELSVILERDPGRARAIARHDLTIYLGLPNYTNTWRRLGFGDADLSNGGSDRLIDALYAWGTVEQIVQRLREHRDAGADHVCLRVITDRPDDAEHLPVAEWRELAPAVLDGA